MYFNQRTGESRGFLVACGFKLRLYWVEFCKCKGIGKNITKGLGEQGWRSGERTCLPSMCSGFDFRTRRHMWVEFVVGSVLCSDGFFSGYSGFPLSLKANIFKFQFDSGMHGHFRTSSCKILGAPWVNKFRFFFWHRS